ncbi:hypothetical protein Nepgr_033834 [Nepenthes gracilis]|uniref:Uncharacterized protein n=1 Tax=Nepenthes gracilis TaxID=150966 RepID=A0AAD3TLV5_NEPGR|nr:hypothetical protein Nepgr_033834 [Nepenthes gracilis]
MGMGKMLIWLAVGSILAALSSACYFGSCVCNFLATQPAVKVIAPSRLKLPYGRSWACVVVMEPLCVVMWLSLFRRCKCED